MPAIIAADTDTELKKSLLRVILTDYYYAIDAAAIDGHYAGCRHAAGIRCRRHITDATILITLRHAATQNCHSYDFAAAMSAITPHYYAIDALFQMLS